MQSQVRFNRFWRRFRRRCGRLLFRARSSTGLQRRFRRRSEKEKVPEKVLGGFGAEPGQGRPWCRARSSPTGCKAKLGSTGFRRRLRRRFRTRFRRRSGRFGAALGSRGLRTEGSGEGSGEGLGGFGAEPGQVQQGSEEGSGQGPEGFGAVQVRFNRVPEKVPDGELWCRARSSSTGFQRRKARSGSRGFRRRFWEAWVQSQVTFNRVPEKVPVKVWEAWAQSQVRFNRVPAKVPEKAWEALVQSQVKFNRFWRRFRRRSGRLWCRARSSTGFRKRFWRRSGRLWCRGKSGSTGSGEGSGEGAGFGAEPNEVQQGSGEGSGEGVRLWWRARLGLSGFRRRFRRRFLRRFS